jgi:hypothetical protein
MACSGTALFFTSMKTDTSWAKFTVISSQVSTDLLLGFSARNYQKALVDESGMMRTQMGSTMDHKWSQFMGHLLRYHAVTVASIR